MVRLLGCLLGLAVLVLSGLVHGLWTDRWRQSTELGEAVERLDSLPGDLGPWKGEPREQDPDALRIAGAVGHYSRSFRDPETGEEVVVILLAGKPARMSVHRPEHCYQAAGFLMSEAPVKVQVRAEGMNTAEFYTGTFTREDTGGPTQLRIYWSFSSGTRWEAPGSPRTRFATDSVLYKLYVIRNVAGSPGTLGKDPAVRLIGQLLPELRLAGATVSR